MLLAAVDEVCDECFLKSGREETAGANVRPGGDSRCRGYAPSRRLDIDATMDV